MIRKIIKYILITVLCSLAGMLLLEGIFLLPSERIVQHVEESAHYISREGAYPKLFSWCTSRLDNSTDSIMLLEAADDTQTGIINKALLVYRGMIDEDSSYNALISHYVDHKEFEKKVTYGRYWHGYLLYVRPLLEITDYRGIRIINGMSQLILDLVIIFLLKKSGMKHCIVPYLLMLLMLMPIVLAYSLQFSSCFYVFTFASIAVLRRKQKKKNTDIVFLLSGIATAYFDFLTYPAVCFGIPMIIDLWLDERNNKEKFLSFFTKGVIWCAGYGFMWTSKWVLASLLTDSDIISDGIKIFLFRTQLESDETVSVISTIHKNISRFISTPFVYLSALYFIYKLYRIIRKRVSLHETVKFSWIYVLISLIPFAWYILVANHSMIHSYFTNKELIISCLAVLSVPAQIDHATERPMV